MKSTESRSLELKKHVAVIHSHSKISLLQRKIANALLYHAYDNLLLKEEHEIQISELTKLIGYDSNDHRKIKDSLIELLATVIEWNIVDGEKLDKAGIWNASSIIADASINGSICTYSYSNKMRKLLYHPSVYGKLDLEVQARFQSNYGLALYENCNRYQEIGQTPWFPLDKFRKLMGVEETKYRIFRDFKSRVINKAVEEVNKFTPLRIEVKFKKINRVVDSIQFSIRKGQCAGITHDELITDDSLKMKLKIEFGLSLKQAAAVEKEYSCEYVLSKISLIKSSPSYLNGKIKNLGRYLLCALEEDFQPIQNPILAKKQIQNNHDHKMELYNKYLYKMTIEKIASLQKNELTEYLKGFEKEITKTVYSASFKTKGLSEPLVRDNFVRYLHSFKNEITRDIPTFTEWAEQELSENV